jgi:outer membrane protein TolC
MKKIFGIVLLASFILAPASSLSLDEAMNAALANDATLADARSKLVIARNAYVKSLSLYGSSLSLSGSSSSTADTDPSTAASAALSVPLAKWITVAVDAKAETSATTGSVSVTLTPFAAVDTTEKAAWDKAFIEAQNAVRNTILSVRREYRAVLTARAEKAYETAAVQTAQNELSRIKYLVELGKDRKSEEISAYSDLMDAQSDLDTAEDDLSTAIQNLSLRTGLAESALSDLEELTVQEGRALVDENSWVASSAELAEAKITLAASVSSAKNSAALPDLSLGSTVSSSNEWSVTAKVSLSPDVVFRKTESTAAENLAIQRRAYANSERSVRTAWQTQKNALTKAEHNYANAASFIETAQLSYTETELLLEKGEASRSTLDSSNENLLSARYQGQKALEALENARDQLDPSWQVSVPAQ